MAGNDRETRRLQMIANLNDLQTADDLDRFLANDPKTRDSAALRSMWRTRVQVAVPRLRDLEAGPDASTATAVNEVLASSPLMDGATVGEPPVVKPLIVPVGDVKPVIIVSK